MELLLRVVAAAAGRREGTACLRRRSVSLSVSTIQEPSAGTAEGASGFEVLVTCRKTQAGAWSFISVSVLRVKDRKWDKINCLFFSGL